MAGQVAFHINHTLSSTSSENACRTLARNTDSATGTLTTAHGQDNSFAFQLQQTFFRIYSNNSFIVLYI